MASRMGRVDPNRCLELFAEQIRLGSRINEGFGAAFRFDCESVFKRLDHPVCVITTRSGLAEPSRNAEILLKNSRLVDLPDVEAPAFEVGAGQIADACVEYLAD